MIELILNESFLRILKKWRSGKPCIRGMRITVYDVLSYLASGMTYQEVLEDFPYLTQEDFLPVLAMPLTANNKLS
jgi:uncharacterized protein (DUF433 family)